MAIESYKNISNQEENAKIQSALEGSTDGVYVEDEEDLDIKKSVPETELKNSEIEPNIEKKAEKKPSELKSQLEIAMEKSDALLESEKPIEVVEKKQTPEESESSKNTEEITSDSLEKEKVEEPNESNEKEEKPDFSEQIANSKSTEELYQAIVDKGEIVSSKKNYEAEELKLMIREIISGERSLSYMPRVNGIREKVREIREQEREKERKEGLNKIVKEFEEKNEESENKPDIKFEKVSNLGLKIWHKWEMLINLSGEKNLIKKINKKIENLEAEKDSISLTLDEKRKQLESEEKNYKDAIEGITDPSLLNSFEKVYKEKTDKINEEISALEKEKDSLEKEILYNKDKIKDSEKNIEEIEKKYTDKIDSKIDSIKKKYDYPEILDSLNKNRERLIRFTEFLEKTDNIISQIEKALENKKLLYEEDVKKIEDRLKNLKNKRKTILNGIKKVTKFIRKDSRDSIYVENKISKLEALKP